MSNTKLVIFLILAIVLFGLALYFLPYKSAHGPSANDTARVETYIQEHISDLSPVKEVLGGTFYVTKISFEVNNAGTVEYEDGHNAHTARFTYGFDEHGEPQINSFILEAQTKIYKNDSLGLSFAYPETYFLESKDTGTDQRRRTTLILTEDTAENQAVREGTVPPREAPVAITVDIHQNLDKYTAESWIRSNANSNFKLSPDGALTQTTVSDRPALSYHWSGLYEADNVVVVTPDFVYSFVVTYLTPEDQIRKDFAGLLKTVSIQEVE